MELKKYLFPLRKWWWLLVAATLVAAVFSFVATLQQPPIYQAYATLMIGRTIEDPNPSANQFWLGQQLAATYADIANRDLVRNATMESLGWTWLPQYRARAENNSQLISIVVTDTNPERAQIVANELARQLILRSPTSTESEEQGRQEFVNQQLDTLQVQISETQDEIRRLQEELGNMVSARQINDTQNQIAALQTKLSTLQGHYANLLRNTQGGAVNTLSVIEPAGLPTRPVGPDRFASVLLAGAIGFFLAAGAAYLLEYLDDTVKTPEEVEQLVNAPVIGRIYEMEDQDDGHLFVAENPRHPIVEEFRTLRANLEFAGAAKPLNTILVTSADMEEGKTLVAANLAVVIAQGEKKVILLDADLRRPKIDKFLELTNDYGLSDVFRGRLSIEKAMKWKNASVTVITAGSPPPNPGELLSSKKMDQVLQRLTEVADMVIVDGPPFVVADAAVLAAKVDGVLLIVRPGFTRKGAVKEMMDQIERAGARVVGVALNRIPRKGSDYYGGKSYLSPYLADPLYFEEEKHGNGFKKGSMTVETGGGVSEQRLFRTQHDHDNDALSDLEDTKPRKLS